MNVITCYHIIIPNYLKNKEKYNDSLYSIRTKVPLRFYHLGHSFPCLIGTNVLDSGLTVPHFITTGKPYLLSCPCVWSDVYRGQLGRSSVLSTGLHRIAAVIDHEVAYMTKLLEVIGQLDTVFSASQALSANQSSESLSCDLTPSHAAVEAT